MNRTHYSFLLVLGASLLLSLLYCPLYDLGMSDKEIFTYMGWAVSKGLVPYRDFFDHKPPLIYFVNAAGIFLGGRWGVWTFNALLSLLATGWFFHCCRQYKLPFPWLLPLLFNLLLRDNLISEGIGMTREYTAFFVIFFFCTLMGRGRYRHYFVGFFTGLVFFMQQDQVLVLLPFLLYFFLSREPVPVTRRLLLVVAGFFTTLLPLLLYFGVHYALGMFWDDAFLFNLNTYTTEKKSLGEHFRTIKRVLDYGNYEMPFIVAISLGIAAFFWKGRRKELILAALAGVLLTLAPEFMGGRFKGTTAAIDLIYYFLPLSASVCLLLFTVFAFSDNTLIGSAKAQLPYGLLLCCSLSYTVLQHATHLQRRDRDPVVDSPELNWLRGHRPENYGLYVFQNEDYICAYYEFRILSPSRWVYQHLWSWYDSWDADGQILHTIGEDLIRHHTTYLILDPATVASFRNKANYEWWMSFVNDHYEIVPLPGDPKSILWRLKAK